MKSVSSSDFQSEWAICPHKVLKPFKLTVFYFTPDKVVLLFLVMYIIVIGSVLFCFIF